MTSYQKLKNRIAELEADRLRLLKDKEYYLTEVIKRAVYEDVCRAYWFGGEPTGELEQGLWSSFKDQDNDTNHQKG